MLRQISSRIAQRYSRLPEKFIWFIWGFMFILIVIMVYVIKEGKFYSDYYPIWWASRRLMDGQVVYGANAIAAMDPEWLASSDTQRMTGYAYPLTTALLGLPFSFFPLMVGHILWTLGGVVLLVAGFRKHHSYGQFLIFAVPFMGAIYLGQAHLWAVAGIVWWWWFQQHSRYKYAWIIALLTTLLKPQIGIVAFMVSSFYFIRDNFKDMLKYGGIAALLLSLTLVFYPTWVFDWLNQIRVYSSTFPQPYFYNTNTLSIALGIFSLFTPWRGILGQYITTSYAGLYVQSGGMLVVLSYKLRWIFLVVVLSYVLPGWLDGITFFTTLFALMIWHCVQVFRSLSGDFSFGQLLQGLWNHDIPPSDKNSTATLPES